jgi:hypothetical protein
MAESFDHKGRHLKGVKNYMDKVNDSRRAAQELSKSIWDQKQTITRAQYNQGNPDGLPLTDGAMGRPYEFDNSDSGQEMAERDLHRMVGLDDPEKDDDLY